MWTTRLSSWKPLLVAAIVAGFLPRFKGPPRAEEEERGPGVCVPRMVVRNPWSLSSYRWSEYYGPRNTLAARLSGQPDPKLSRRQ